MGLLGSLIGGAFDLASGMLGETKLRKQIEGSVEMRDAFFQECAAFGKEVVLEAKHELYHEGLSEAADDLITSLIALNGFFRFYMGIIKEEDALGQAYGYVENIYNTLFVMNEKYADDEAARADYAAQTDALIEKTKEKITELLTLRSGAQEGMNRSINFSMVLPLLCLLEIVSGDSGFHATAESLHAYLKDCTIIFTTLHPLEHGEFELDDPQTIDIDKVKADIRSMEEHVSDNQTGYFEGIVDHLHAGTLNALGSQMWYYASLSPFDQKAFDEAGDTLDAYRDIMGNDLERVLAEVYIKNRLGGEMLVKQNIDQIMEKASIRNPVFARALCSFLAWIGCYQTELEVLKKAVQEKIQLTPDMLERLEFLAKGGTDVKFTVYDVPAADGKLWFDSSTEGMDAAGIDALFNTLQKKRRTLDYSLVMKKWTKTIPLPKEKIFSPEALDAAFKELVEDFDNEILYRLTDASALDLTNLEYQNCALFRFTFERSRGVTMLFDCEKFGRNLNVSILTLFTPDEEMGENAASYAKSVVNNRYAESFRESILQALDQSLKEKADVYGSQSGAASSTIFE